MENMEKTEIRKPQNQFQRVVNIIMAPVSTIDDIKEKPNYILPLAIIWAIGLLSVLVTKDLSSALMDISYQNAGMTAEQIASTKEMMGGYMTVMMYVTVLFMPLAPFVKGSVAHLLSLVFSGEGKYGSTVSLMLNAYMIPTLGTLISLPLMLITQNGAFSFSPAILLPLSKFGTPIYSTLAALNIFTIWYLAVTIVGIKRIHNVATWKAAFAVILPFAIMVSFTWISVLMGSAPSGL